MSKRKLDLWHETWGFELPEKYQFIFQTFFLFKCLRRYEYNNPSKSDLGYAIALRYGWDGKGQKTLRETGRLMPRANGSLINGVTPERIRQYLSKAKRLVRRPDVFVFVFERMEYEDRGAVLKHVPLFDIHRYREIVSRYIQP